QMNPNTIMTTLVRLSDQAREQDQSGGKASFSSNDKGTAGNSTSAIKSYLTEDEIAGNLFIFTAAGFETTSNTLSYAVTLLAAYPKWQSWIQEEIDLVLGTSGLDQGEQRPLQDYATVSPKLMRCKALMRSLKTLRDPFYFKLPMPFTSTLWLCIRQNRLGVPVYWTSNPHAGFKTRTR
ncbi:hypothetical protein N0V91_001615, partial [Didymella pomorum]